MWCLAWFGRLRPLPLTPAQCAEVIPLTMQTLVTYGTFVVPRSRRSGYAGICLELSVPGTCPE
jgi:hypothetical protein